MSGIVAALGGVPQTRQDLALRMARSGAHRGPDGTDIRVEDEIALGHLLHATLPEDIQGPVEHDDVLVALDGWLAHRNELEQALGAEAPSRGASDATWIAAAYRRYGPMFPARLSGDFAFVLYDRRERLLLAGRDVFGSRPLYHASAGGGAIIASEPAMLLAAGISSEVDQDWVPLALAGGWLDQLDRSPFRAVRSVPPRHTLVWRRGSSSPRAHPYFRFTDVAPSRYRSPAEAAGDLREQLLDATREALRSRVPVGVALSGGLDSTSVAACARATGLPQGAPAYSFSFEGLACDESAFARPAAEALRLSFVPVPLEDYGTLEGLRPVLRRVGPAPAGNTFMNVALAEVARRNGTQVLLDGQDGDAVLWDGPRLAHLLRRRAWGVALREARGDGRGLARGLRTLVGTWGTHLAPHSVRRSFISRRLRRYPAWARPALEQGIAAANGRRPRSTREEICRRLDSGIFGQAMAVWDVCDRLAGVESRHPFFDLKVATFLASLEPEAKVERDTRGRLVTKAVLRRALEGVLPEPVASRRDKSDLSPGFSRAFRREVTEAERLARTAAEWIPVVRDARLSTGDDPEADLLFWRAASLGAWIEETRNRAG